MKKEKMHRVLPHIDSMVSAVFSPCKITLIYLHHNELLCITSSFHLKEEQFLPQIEHLRRQLATYFSSVPILCYKENIENACLLKESYHQCIEAFHLHFYHPDLFVMHVSEKKKLQNESTQNSDSLITTILDDMHAGNIPLLNQHITSQFLQWS